jgi:hypothetical protein
VRLLCFAVKEVDIKTAVQNATELLRKPFIILTAGIIMVTLLSTGPGGYIEWFDTHWISYLAENPELEFFHETWLPYIQSVDLSMEFTSCVKRALEELGVEILTGQKLRSNSRPELIDGFREWLRQSMLAGAMPAIQCSGKAKDYESAREIVKETFKEVRCYV